MPSPRGVRDISQCWIRPYYPAFSGLRGCAILLVFCRHYAVLVSSWRIFWPGWVGVDLFFVLSGFLITGILYDSTEQPRYFLNFYIRRALRIFPLFYGIFFLLALLRVLGWAAFPRKVWLLAAYIGNLASPWLILHHVSFSYIFLPVHPPWSLRLDHLWSLCVEEQFYLIWPLVISRVRSRRILLRICAAGIVLVPVLRSTIFYFASPQMLATGVLYNSTYARCDTLLMGAFIAIWLRLAQPSPRALQTLAYSVAGVSLALLIIGVSATIRRWPTSFTNPFLATFGFTLIGLVMSGILLRCLDGSSWLCRAMQQRQLSTLGVISYGFYLLHELYEPIAEHFLLQHTHTPNARYIAVLGFFFFTVVLAKMSFRFYEAPILRLRRLWVPKSLVTVPAEMESSPG